MKQKYLKQYNIAKKKHILVNRKGELFLTMRKRIKNLKSFSFLFN